MPLSWAEKHTLNLAYLQVIKFLFSKNKMIISTYQELNETFKTLFKRQTTAIERTAYIEERISHYEASFPYFRNLLSINKDCFQLFKPYLSDIYQSELEVLKKCLKKVEKNEYLIYDKTAKDEMQFKKERLQAQRKEEL